jgi:hypothetical protein
MVKKVKKRAKATPKAWKYLTDNKLKGAYGETDFEKKVVRVNKKRHKKGPKWGIAGKDNTILNTIVHEDMHVKRPKMKERDVRKATRKKVAKMDKRTKKKYYNKLKS